MNSETILQSNKLIAKFMKYDSIDCSACRYNFDCNHFQCGLTQNEKDDLLSYNCSMDWLMPVIDKIESLGYTWEMGKQLSNHFGIPAFYYCRIGGIGEVQGKSHLEAVYGMCVQFITWYNQQKQQDRENESN